MSFLANDTVKKVLMWLAFLNGAVLGAPATGVHVPATVLSVCGLLASVFAALGITSGGTSGLRSDVSRDAHQQLVAAGTVKVTP